MRVGYIRVSTTHQNTDRQEDSLEQMNVEKLFIEKASGKDRRRPQLKAMMDFVQAGDTVVVHELSRMARSVVDLYDIAKELNDKGVSLESLKEDIDLTSATGKLTFGIMAVMAQFERDLLLERQKEGIAAAKRNGKRFGRPEKKMPDQFKEICQRCKRGEVSTRQAADILKISHSTFYRRYRKEVEENVSNSRRFDTSE